MRILEGKFYKGLYTGVIVKALESTSNPRFDGEVIQTGENKDFEVGHKSGAWHTSSFFILEDEERVLGKLNCKQDLVKWIEEEFSNNNHVYDSLRKLKEHLDTLI